MTMSEAIRPLEVERASRVQIFLWVVAAYLAYVSAWFTFESYARHRFSVVRESTISTLHERRARLLAETRRSTSLSEKEEWLPYQVATVGSLILACSAAAWVGFVVVRSFIRRRRRTGSSAPVRFLALGTLLPAAAVLLLIILPPAVAGILWETQDWLLWPAG